MAKWSDYYPYTYANVRLYAVDRPGLYQLLTDEHRIFYVGRANILRRRLREHLSKREGNRLIKRHLAEHSCLFCFMEAAPDANTLAIERELIHKYNPECNIDIKTLEERWSGGMRRYGH